MADFEVQLAAYAQAIETFRLKHNLPDEWFAKPDHVAIKCADGADYVAEMRAWLPKAAQAQYVQLNGRRLGSLRLMQPMQAGNLGQIEWLEIMEPRPEKVGVDPVGVDHMEFVYGDYEAAAKVLEAKAVSYEPQGNPSQQWLSVEAGGREFKLTGKKLADVVAAEFAVRAATALK